MPEVGGTWPEFRGEREDCSVGFPNGSLRGFAQECFELGARKFEIRRVFRRIAQRRPRVLDRLAFARNLVVCEVVYHDNIVALEYGKQAQSDIRRKHLPVHGPFRYRWSSQPTGLSSIQIRREML
jgi:hypothetical protein